MTPATLSTVTAAMQIGGEVHMLFAGPGSEMQAVEDLNTGILPAMIMRCAMAWRKILHP